MKKRVMCVVLAALLALGMCTPALASEGGVFDKAWEMALVLKDAVGVSIYAEAVLTWTDPVFQAMDVEAGVGLEATTVNFSDGYMVTLCEYEFGAPNQEWDNQGLLVIPGSGAYFDREFLGANGDESTTLEHADAAESAAVCDVSRAYLYFASLGDNEMGAQVVDGEYAVYTASGDGLRLLLETCFPQTITGLGDALDWQSITASVRAKVDPYGDNTYIVLESPQLGAAMLGQVPGLESAQDVQLEIEIDVEAFIAGQEDEYADEYERMRADPSQLQGFTEVSGPLPPVQTLVEYVRAAYDREVGTTSQTEDAKDAIRAELAGQTGSAGESSLSGEDAKNAIRDELAGQIGG